MYQGLLYNKLWMMEQLTWQGSSLTVQEVEEGVEATSGDQVDQLHVVVPVVGGEEDLISLVERANPTIPPPQPAVARLSDSDGWSLIARLGGWGSILCQFLILDKCPAQHEEAWCAAWEEVLRRVEEAPTDQQMDLALMWMMFLPQALLRKPTRGGRAGRGQVAGRFRCLQRGDWGSLVSGQEEDMETLLKWRDRTRVRREESEEEKMARRGREAVALISGGQIGKAMRRLLSHGAEDPVILQQLCEKYPVQGRPLPDSVVQGDAVPSLASLREALTDLDPSTAPGYGGLRPGFLSLLGRKMSEEGMLRLQELGMKYVRGSLPAWFYVCWLSVQTVPLFKSVEQTSVRPLGLRNPLLKCWHKMVSRENRAVIRDFVEPQQVVLSQGGAALLVTSVRESLELHRDEDWVCVKLDIENAFNEVYRAETVKMFSDEVSLQHMASFTAVTLTPTIGLECGGKLWGSSGEVGTQGDPKTGDKFCVTLQPSLEKLDTDIRARGGFAMAGADDIFGVGPRGSVLPAVVAFAEEVRQRCGLSLQWGKTKYFCWEGGLPENTPPDLQLAGQEVGGVFRRGFLFWGVRVGEEEYVKAVLEKKVRQIVEEAEPSLDKLHHHRQAAWAWAWAALKRSVWPRFEYWASHCYPSDYIPVARELDKQLWQLLEGVCGTSIPQVTSRATSSWDCKLPVDVPGREDLTFAAWVVRQPVKLGGLGLRSYSEM